MNARHSARILPWARRLAWAGVAALALGFLSSDARAADLPLPAPLSGLGSLPSPWNFFLPNYEKMAVPYPWNGFFASPLISYQSAQFSGAGGRLLNDARGLTFGGTAGYDYHVGRFVIGPAADLSYSLMHASANSPLDFGAKADIGWVGSARARVGFTFDRFLIYGTGGVAFAEMKVNGPFNLVSTTHTEPGWTAGIGVQYLWSDKAILQLEYRRLELENKDFYALPLFRTKVGVRMNLIGAGFYMKF